MLKSVTPSKSTGRCFTSVAYVLYSFLVIIYRFLAEDDDSKQKNCRNDFRRKQPGESCGFILYEYFNGNAYLFKEYNGFVSESL